MSEFRNPAARNDNIIKEWILGLKPGRLCFTRDRWNLVKAGNANPSAVCCELVNRDELERIGHGHYQRLAKNLKPLEDRKTPHIIESLLPFKADEDDILDCNGYRICEVMLKSTTFVEDCIVTAEMAKRTNVHTPLYDALKELLELKDLKDKDGKTEEYEARQPKAWDAARAIIKEIEHES